VEIKRDDKAPIRFFYRRLSTDKEQSGESSVYKTGVYEMSMFVLKLIAIVSMFLDHIGYHYGTDIFRIIGRLAFPIFAFLVVNGFFKTRNRWKYLLRMFVFALISEIPFDLCFRDAFWEATYQNVFFTLSLGLLALIVTDIMRKSAGLRYFCFVPEIVCMAAAEYISSDYGFEGVLIIAAFYACYNRKADKIRIIPATVCVAAITLYPIVYLFAYDILKTGVQINKSYIQTFIKNNSWDFTQLFRLVALILIDSYNGKHGYQFENRFLSAAVKYGFYLFYPVHLLLLCILIKIV